MQSWKIIHKNEKNLTPNEIIDVLLKNRNISDDQKEEFLNPTKPLEITLSKLNLKNENIENSIKRLKKAKKNNEKIIIYGDYDADGITATAILWETLHYLGFNVIPHIPDRFTEGYGINSESIKFLYKTHKDLKLIITVDNGIVANKAVNVANNLDIDVIITDHHQKGDKLPNAFEIVHSTLISGSALAWFFSREIVRSMGTKNDLYLLQTQLELAAIGSVADQMPVTGLTRSIIKHGLEELKFTKRHGLNQLITQSAIKKESISSYTIAFQIAPRLNATGRLENGIESLRLLCTRDKLRAARLANKIEEINKKRQSTVSDAIKKAEENLNQKNKLILVQGEFNEGIIGLIASKITEKYNKPSIVLSVGEKVSKASARSIANFNIINAIKKFEDLIIEGGGHPMAAGFSIINDNIKDFEDNITKFANKNIKEADLVNTFEIDLELQLSSLTTDLINQIEALEPFGIGNPRPKFLTKSVNLDKVKKIGKNNNHLSFYVNKGEIFFKGLLFNHEDNLPDGTSYDIAYQPSINEWNGKVNIELILKDLKNHESEKEIQPTNIAR